MGGRDEASAKVSQSVSTVAETLDPRDDLDLVVEEARDALVDLQRDDGHWVFEFEPDATPCQ